eukprot:TRINITY_DN4206_c0_g1_i1.p1 TRINITY_DN4206_c0_g1~~TRINITY_DN4206_c0_g1_i1.p1  ORF type:complete len:143 (+),score=31.70 TRINITY_DN4206_c0_g1_i1:281-709(+)
MKKERKKSIFQSIALDQDQQKSKAAPRDGKRIELGALLPTVCRRCGGKGHLANECFNISGAQYELIPEPPPGEEEEVRKEKSPSPVGRVASLKDALRILQEKAGSDKKRKHKHKDKKKDKKHRHKDKKEKHKHKHKKHRSDK